MDEFKAMQERSQANWASAAQVVGCSRRAEVIAVWPFGVFVNVDGKFLGLLPVVRMTEATQRSLDVEDYPQVGEIVHVSVVAKNDRNFQLDLKELGHNKGEAQE